MNERSPCFFFSQLLLFVICSVSIFAQYSENWKSGTPSYVPADAVAGGFETEIPVTYVRRVKFRDEWIAGRLRGGRCYFADGRRERSGDDFQILTGGRNEFRWRNESKSDYAVSAGDDSFICRVAESRGVFLGDLKDGRCRYTSNGVGTSSRDYEFLEGDKLAADLLKASEKGDLAAVRSAIRAGQMINQRNSSGRTALMIAAEKGHLAIVEELIYNRAAINERDDDGNTALFLSAREGREKIVKRLLREGAATGIPNEEGKTALIAASGRGYEDILRELIRSDSFTGIDSYESVRAFLEAATNSRKESLEVFLDNGMDVNASDPDTGRTALMQAAEAKHSGIVEYLLKKSADIFPVDREGNSAFVLAAIADSDRTLKAFMEETRRVRPSDSEAQKGLRAAARLGKRDSLRYLIRRGVDVNSRGDFNGFTALMWAASEGREDSTEMLIKAGADLNAQNLQGETALMLAAANSKTNTLKKLISAGAKLDLRDGRGRTALDLAIENGHDDTRKELEKAGAVMQ